MNAIRAGARRSDCRNEYRRDVILILLQHNCERQNRGSMLGILLLAKCTELAEAALAWNDCLVINLRNIANLRTQAGAPILTD